MNDLIRQNQNLKRWKDYIIEITSDYYEMYEMVVAKIYFYEQKWTYSNMAGGLSIGIDRTLNNAPVFIMFDLNNFDIIFKLEIYTIFNQYYQQINTTFFQFQLPECKTKIGFSFTCKDDATLVRDLVEQFCLETGEIHLQHMQREEQQKKQEIDVLEERERFKKIENLKQEEKEIIKNAGISKKEYAENSHLQEIIYQAFLNSRVIKQQKDSILSSFIHKLPEKKQQQKSVLGFGLAKLVGEQVTKQIQEEQKQHNQQQLQVSTNLLDLQRSRLQQNNQNQQMPQESSAQMSMKGPPPLSQLLQNNIKPNSLQPPSFNTLKPPSAVSQTPSNKPSPYKSSNLALLDEIRNPNIKLRHVETKQGVTKTSELPKEFSKQEEVSITAQLAAEVNKRRKELKKNYLEDSEEESPWDDSDDYEF